MPDNATRPTAWRLVELGPAPPTLSERSRRCVETAWDDSHFSADQDWVPMTNGKEESGDTLWRWVSMGSSTGHLQNKRTGGHINFRPEGYVRGHGNENRPPRRPAPACDTTKFERHLVDMGHQLHEYPCAIEPVYNLRFLTRGGGMLHVKLDGGLTATKRFCTDDASCLFSFQESTRHSGWMTVRSVVTGGLLRMVGEYHPPFDGWDGVAKPKAAPKSRSTLREQSTRAAAARRATCPLRRGGPAGWTYNASAYAGVVDRWLAPWYDGGITATIVDVGFMHEMYPYQNRFERPSLHLSLLGKAKDDLHFKWQLNAPHKGQARPTAGTASAGGRRRRRRVARRAGEPPADSDDASFLRMMHEVEALVELPAIELVAHTASLPKVPAQNLEIVFGPVTDEAHNDVPVPSPWLYDRVRSGTTTSASCARPVEAKPTLIMIAQCLGPVDGYRGPLWRHYPPHRAALLPNRYPSLRGRLAVSLSAPCVGPTLEDKPIEFTWDRQAAIDLKAEAPSSVWDTTLAERCDRDPCLCRWELLLDEQGPPRRLITAMARGATIFRQESPYVEFFTTLLQPWVHYIPVADHLDDLAARVAWADANPKQADEMGRAARLVAARLHAHEIACFWWQLLTALAPLEDFEPRSNTRRLGFTRYSTSGLVGA